MALARSLAGSLARPLASAITGAGGGGGSTPPLDTVTSAVLAFSVARKLRTAYSGSAIRVRRSSDDAEQDIGFDGSGNLDESALTTFCGAGNGFVVTLYDQSGAASAVDYAQGTASLQMQIVSAGAVVKKDGSVAVQQFATGASAPYLTLASWSTRPSSANICEIVAAASGRQFITATGGAGNASGVAENGAGSACFFGAGTPTYQVNGAAITATRDAFHDAVAIDALISVRHSGVDMSNAAWADLKTSFTALTSFDGAEYLSEQIVVTNSSDATSIVSNQAAYFGLTLP